MEGGCADGGAAFIYVICPCEEAEEGCMRVMVGDKAYDQCEPGERVDMCAGVVINRLATMRGGG